MKKFIFLSILLHTIFATVFLKFQLHILPEQKSSSFDLTYLESKAISNTHYQTQAKKYFSDLKSFSPNHNIFLKNKENKQASLSEEYLKYQSWKSENWLGGRSQNEMSIFLWTYKKIRQSLFYPKELIKIAEQGSIKARLYFSATGNFIREKLEIVGESKYLRNHVRNVVLQAFSEPLPSILFKSAKELSITCYFRFRLATGANPKDAFSELSIAGDNLYFDQSDSFLAAQDSKPLRGVLPPSIPREIIMNLDVLKFLEKNSDPLYRFQD